MWHYLKARAVTAAFDCGDHEQMHNKYLSRSVAIDLPCSMLNPQGITMEATD